jgi:hypothetical protein
MKAVDPLVQNGKWISLFWHQNGDLLVEGRSEFYEISYWIRYYSKVLKYPTGYQHNLLQLKLVNTFKVNYNLTD